MRLPFHDWYRFALAFDPALVRRYLAEFELSAQSRLLDPFCGGGTTLVEAKRLGIPAVGVEAHPFAHFAATVKCDWAIDPRRLRAASSRAARVALARFTQSGGAPPGAALTPEARALLVSGSISPRPLAKAVALADCLTATPARETNHQLLALAETLVRTASNLRFGPEVGLGRVKPHAPVFAAWLRQIAQMARDLSQAPAAPAPTQVLLGDARALDQLLPPASVDGVITSPPYPNEKDYTRLTRLEAVLLGFIRTRADLQQVKRRLLCSNTRNVYAGPHPDELCATHPEIDHLAAAIAARRRALGKTSGFERLYPRVIKRYFGGLARHLASLRPVLRPGARLAYVVGDQASFLRVFVPTGRLLAEIAAALGYQVLRRDLYRMRWATATRQQLGEEVVVLRWRGN